MSKYSASALLFIVSIFLFATATLIGSHIDANSMLVEPAFFCLLLGYLSLLASLVLAVYSFIKDKIFKKHSR